MELSTVAYMCRIAGSLEGQQAVSVEERATVLVLGVP